MSIKNERLPLGPKPLLDAAVDLREQLRDARRRPGLGAGITVLALGVVLALNALWVVGSVRPKLERAETAAVVAQDVARDALGETSLVRLQNDNLVEIIDFSSRYRIPADLAQAIHAIAISEDLDPDLAFRLVQTESSFRRNALSEAGAVGYTQILPSTAVWLDSSVEEANLYQRDINLRLGFRYLRLLLEQNAGDMRLALLAYNRGPGTVRAIVANGGDPANGYATRIMGSE
ncbi:MAG: transglycosylase SLT domain-containing protein [Gemmatimonadetes bacterium]|nr:transglycosylase SLT domain-containing protein [Gemmatimonadota bacterium]